ncbi:unnamed protein product [Orchesella dallaii]|uniref:Protein kinase domain-containing protein n=1 Tax=Orchesella dallaii TaxID=48710 RepID=A0ABP1RUS2_9HEXA
MSNMEAWEKNHIRQNLPELISLTSCTSTLMAYFVSKNILSDNDCSDLRAIAVEQQQSARLYDILFNKTDSYKELHKILEKTCQSGALQIIESGYWEHGPLKISRGIVCDADSTPVDNIGYQRGTMKLCAGCFGGRDVSVKIINTFCCGISSAINEVYLLLKSDAHENILRYLNIERRPYSIIIALESITTTLHKWVVTGENLTISHADLLRQATTGISHLHSLQIVHGYLKPENLVLCKISETAIRVKISDFRVGKYTNPIGPVNECRTNICIAEGVGWMAPEILRILDTEPDLHQPSQKTIRSIQNEITFKSDIFSLGCIFNFVITCGKHPFGGNFSRHGNILKHTYIIDEKMNMSMIPRMIDCNPNDRPSAEAIVRDDAFFNSC